jgi:hypothetical protein
MPIEMCNSFKSAPHNIDGDRDINRTMRKSDLYSGGSELELKLLGTNRLVPLELIKERFRSHKECHMVNIASHRERWKHLLV